MLEMLYVLDDAATLHAFAQKDCVAYSFECGRPTSGSGSHTANIAASTGGRSQGTAGKLVPMSMAQGGPVLNHAKAFGRAVLGSVPAAPESTGQGFKGLVPGQARAACFLERQFTRYHSARSSFGCISDLLRRGLSKAH